MLPRQRHSVKLMNISIVTNHFVSKWALQYSPFQLNDFRVFQHVWLLLQFFSSFEAYEYLERTFPNFQLFKSAHS